MVSADADVVGAASFSTCLAIPKSSTQTRHVTVALAREEDVLGLQVAMHEPRGVRGFDRVEDGQHDRRSLGDRERPSALEPSSERLALEELHDEERRAVVAFLDLTQLDDVRVLHGGGRARLAQEALLQRAVLRELFEHHLHGDPLVRLEMSSLPHLAHATLSEARLEHVLSSENVAGDHVPSSVNRAGLEVVDVTWRTRVKAWALSVVCSAR